jgi:hypothetical protein
MEGDDADSVMAVSGRDGADEELNGTEFRAVW